MTGPRSVSCTIDVGVDPQTAFTAFTDEMDNWWMRSPISFYDASRTIARRCEPGVGGRIVEVYDEAGDVLELGRITVWEPGVKLQWLSSVDDVEVEVRFAPIPDGTNVEVHARVLPGGDENVTGSFSFVRVVPDWFVKWCDRRATASRAPWDLARVNLALYYRQPVAAALAGSPPRSGSILRSCRKRTMPRSRGSSSTSVTARSSSSGSTGERPEGAPVTLMPWVYVDDLDAHFAQARDADATIVEPIHQHGYRAYVADDLEGNRWTFAQARPTMA